MSLERHPAYDLDLTDLDEVRRRVVEPVIRGFYRGDECKGYRFELRDGDREHPHWPADLPIPQELHVLVTLRDGDVYDFWLGRQGHVDPHHMAERLACLLEQDFSTSAVGWGENRVATYEVLPPVESGT